MSLCPCGSNLKLDACCGLYLAGAPAPTAEALLRARYTAHVVNQLDYVEKTCTPESVKEFDRVATERTMPDTEWLGLTITKVEKGGVNDETGAISFAFRYKYKKHEMEQTENSTFIKVDGKWFYQDSEINPKGPPVHVEHIGRNDPCTCGSGKKYKKCCGA